MEGGERERKREEGRRDMDRERNCKGGGEREGRRNT